MAVKAELSIESYSFGRMVINGKTYTKDLIILPHRIFSPWWRKEGHLLQLDDLAPVTELAPLTLIVGTGMYGVMSVPPSLVTTLNSRHVSLEALPTSDAVSRFNRLVHSKKRSNPLAGAFHLTC